MNGPSYLMLIHHQSAANNHVHRLHFQLCLPHACVYLFGLIFLMMKLFLAQAGCTVITECEVRYIVKEVDDDHEEHYGVGRKHRRRWRVYLDNLEYICADFVVLSGMLSNLNPTTL